MSTQLSLVFYKSWFYFINGDISHTSLHLKHTIEEDLGMLFFGNLWLKVILTLTTLDIWFLQNFWATFFAQFW